MVKYREITKYLDYFENDNYGEWIVDKESEGTLEDPIHMPFVGYSSIVIRFENDIIAFVDANEDMELYHYYTILEENGFEWTAESMKAADPSVLDGKCVMALIVGIIRAERFCDGALLSFLKNGCIRNWLIRLREIDESLG